MPEDKEKLFLAAMEKLSSDDEKAREEARATISGFGAEAMPYLVTGANHTSVWTRSHCMTQIGALSGRNATKHVIELFFSAMPDAGEAATYQVPYIRAIKTTLSQITGQSFINVEPGNSMVQDGLAKYVEWYNANYDRLPPQLGEPKLDATDPEYGEKLKKARELKLAKRAWPRPPMPADQTSNKTNSRPQVPAGGGERKTDKDYGDSYKKIGREDALKRPQDK
jgi:hypothetical protein